MNDYLVTVEPNTMSGEAIFRERLHQKSEDYLKGFIAGLQSRYSDYNKYRINYIKL